MKYLTKEWYKLGCAASIDLGLRVHKGAAVYDEELYKRLYKKKEKQYVIEQRDIYNVDPRDIFIEEGTPLVPLNKFVNEEVIEQGDLFIYHMSDEEREYRKRMIERYDNRPDFDEELCRLKFKTEWLAQNEEYIRSYIPQNILEQIADLRVFILGYCTKDIKMQLKKLRIENEKKRNQIDRDYEEAYAKENIPDILRHKFGFHDCEVTELILNKDIVMRFDTDGGFSEFNKLIFVDAEILKQDGDVVGSTWIYEELYRKDEGYEAHMLLDGKDMVEFTVQCKDIMIEIEN